MKVRELFSCFIVVIIWGLLCALVKLTRGKHGGVDWVKAPGVVMPEKE